MAKLPFTADQLQVLKVGDQVMSPGILRGIDPKMPVVWDLVKASANRDKFRFDLFMFGDTMLASVEVKVTAKGLEVTEI